MFEKETKDVIKNENETLMQVSCSRMEITNLYYKVEADCTPKMKRIEDKIKRRKQQSYCDDTSDDSLKNNGGITGPKKRLETLKDFKINNKVEASREVLPEESLSLKDPSSYSPYHQESKCSCKCCFNVITVNSELLCKKCRDYEVSVNSDKYNLNLNSNSSSSSNSNHNPKPKPKPNPNPNPNKLPEKNSYSKTLTEEETIVSSLCPKQKVAYFSMVIQVKDPKDLYDLINLTIINDMKIINLWQEEKESEKISSFHKTKENYLTVGLKEFKISNIE